jgi:hypothetical protein
MYHKVVVSAAWGHCVCYLSHVVNI